MSIGDLGCDTVARGRVDTHCSGEYRPHPRDDDATQPCRSSVAVGEILDAHAVDHQAPQVKMRRRRPDRHVESGRARGSEGGKLFEKGHVVECSSGSPRLPEF
ncbi:hypothetical protein A3K89_03540 [Rhodococcoides kyotonense]|uniref:Uncharacterized protein n=1 Tax=Rhodococcoides kyotonense TaxID=398843 RepID=A0A177YH71_9NOCA|nr:hypothetical protein A3K89_03540 [Rhodococcus kyotonensis]